MARAPAAQIVRSIPLQLHASTCTLTTWIESFRVSLTESHQRVLLPEAYLRRERLSNRPGPADSEGRPQSLAQARACHLVDTLPGEGFPRCSRSAGPQSQIPDEPCPAGSRLCNVSLTLFVAVKEAGRERKDGNTTRLLTQMVKFWRIVIAEALPTEVQEPERAGLPVKEGRGSPDRP